MPPEEQFGIQANMDVVSFLRGAAAYNAGVDSVVRKTRDGARAMDTAGSNTAKKTDQNFRSMRATWTKATIAIAAVTAATIKMYREMEQGATLVRQERMFVRLSGGVEEAAKKFDILDQAMLGTASDAEVVNAGIRLMNMGLGSSDELLARAAKNIAALGSATRGFTADQSFDRFMLMISNKSLKRVDDFGLNMGEVKKRFEELKGTGLGEELAFQTAVMEKMDIKMQELGLGTIDTKVKIDQLNASVQNMEDEVSKGASALAAAALPMFDVAEGATFASEGINFLTKSFLASIAVAHGFSDAMIEILNSVTELRMPDVRGAFLGGLAESWEAGMADIDIAEPTRELSQLKTMMDNVEGGTEEATEALTRYQAKLRQIAERELRQIWQASLNADREMLDSAIDRARQMEDLERNLAKARLAALAQLNAQMRSIAAQGRKASESAAYDHGRRMADIEYRYREQMLSIQRQYEDTMWDAISTRDATSALKAMRKRDRDTDDAKRQRDKQAGDATADYERQKVELERSLKEQQDSARAAYQQQLEDLKETRREQEEALALSLAREEEDQERHDKWRTQDMQRQFGLERSIADSNYRYAENALAAHLARMAAISGAYGHTGTRGFIGGFAEGGSFVTSGPTTATFGEGGTPELVTAVPLSPVASTGPSNFSGVMQHSVGGAISAQMDGYEGRLSAAVNAAVIQAFREILR